MTALGKFLVFLTTTGAILLAVMTYSSWVTSYDFTDRTGKDGAPDGTFLALKQKIDAIQKSGQLGSMSKGYTDSVTQLTLMEKNRTDADVFQTAQIVFLQTKATKALPVTEVIRTKNGVELNPNFTPKMTVAKNKKRNSTLISCGFHAIPCTGMKLSNRTFSPQLLAPLPSQADSQKQFPMSGRVRRTAPETIVACDYPFQHAPDGAFGRSAGRRCFSSAW